MASVGGDLAADDRDDFGVGALGSYTTKRALLRKASHERCSRGSFDFATLPPRRWRKTQPPSTFNQTWDTLVGQPFHASPPAYSARPVLPSIRRVNRGRAVTSTAACRGVENPALRNEPNSGSPRSSGGIRVRADAPHTGWRVVENPALRNEPSFGSPSSTGRGMPVRTDASAVLCPEAVC
jgi:hypothetical protein